MGCLASKKWLSWHENWSLPCNDWDLKRQLQPLHKKPGRTVINLVEEDAPSLVHFDTYRFSRSAQPASNTNYRFINGWPGARALKNRPRDLGHIRSIGRWQPFKDVGAMEWIYTAIFTKQNDLKLGMQSQQWSSHFHKRIASQMWGCGEPQTPSGEPHTPQPMLPLIVTKDILSCNCSQRRHWFQVTPMLKQATKVATCNGSKLPHCGTLFQPPTCFVVFPSVKMENCAM